MEYKIYTNMKVNIYGIINPITKEIIYIGQTPSNCPYNYKGYIIKRII